MLSSDPELTLPGRGQRCSGRPRARGRQNRGGDNGSHTATRSPAVRESVSWRLGPPKCLFPTGPAEDLPDASSRIHGRRRPFRWPSCGRSSANTAGAGYYLLESWTPAVPWSWYTALKKVARHDAQNQSTAAIVRVRLALMASLEHWIARVLALVALPPGRVQREQPALLRASGRCGAPHQCGWQLSASWQGLTQSTPQLP